MALARASAAAELVPHWRHGGKQSADDALARALSLPRVFPRLAAAVGSAEQAVEKGPSVRLTLSLSSFSLLFLSCLLYLPPYVRLSDLRLFALRLMSPLAAPLLAALGAVADLRFRLCNAGSQAKRWPGRRRDRGRATAVRHDHLGQHSAGRQSAVDAHMWGGVGREDAQEEVCCGSWREGKER